MQIIKGKTNIDFIGKRRIAILLSTAVNIAIVVGIAGFGFNWGVDYAGGTLVEVKFSGVVTAEQVREGALKGGLTEPQVQSIGSAEESTFMLRMGGVTQLTAESEQLAEKAIRALPGIDITAFNKDLDNISWDGLSGVWQNAVHHPHPDPVSGMHCWHQKVLLEATGPGVKIGDLQVDIAATLKTYQVWRDELTRPAPGPGGLRRPEHLKRPWVPITRAAYKMPV